MMGNTVRPGTGLTVADPHVTWLCNIEHVRVPDAAQNASFDLPGHDETDERVRDDSTGDRMTVLGDRQRVKQVWARIRTVLP